MAASQAVDMLWAKMAGLEMVVTKYQQVASVGVLVANAKAGDLNVDAWWYFEADVYTHMLTEYWQRLMSHVANDGDFTLVPFAAMDGKPVAVSALP